MQTLATRLRPTKLDQVIGQEFVVKVLKHALRSNKLSSICLLTGPAGTGKTTLARLIALNLICKDECGVCQQCKLLWSGTHPDIVEFDAATYTGVEQIRSVLESCDYKPQLAPVRVYIIDEAHMLSKSAISALLKIMEDTPENVWFILATTESAKIPETIVSRALNFKLSSVDTTVMMTYLQQVVTEQHIDADRHGLELICTYACGCVRAALSVLEQVSLQGKVDQQNVLTCTKMFDPALVQELYDHVKAQNIEQVMLIAQRIRNPYGVVLQLLDLATQKSDWQVGLQMGYAMEELAFSPMPNKLIGVLLAKSSFICGLPTSEQLWQALESVQGKFDDKTTADVDNNATCAADACSKNLAHNNASDDDIRATNDVGTSDIDRITQLLAYAKELFNKS